MSEEELEECGMTMEGCSLVGSEYCDFECPFKDKGDWAEEEYIDMHL